MMKRTNKKVGYWLILGAALVLTMVVIGGITRLTHSGLSMVSWKPISGTLPPMNETEWLAEFESYKTSPEFQKVNSHFSLEEFKDIFFWEYVHRLLGRVLGIVFLIPFLYFLFKGYLNDVKLRLNLLIIFLLGGLQGLIGWYMVRSGLIDNPAVSHYRLALHFSTALFLVSYITWTALGIFYPIESKAKSALRRPLIYLLPILVVQIIYGAFVAGLKAGFIYPTYPKMGTAWFPETGVNQWSQLGFASIFESPIVIQFIHRWFAFAVIAMVIYIFYLSRKIRLANIQASYTTTALLLMVIAQFLLGVFTLINAVPVSLGVLHQLGAVVLLLLCVADLFFNTYKVES